MSELINSELEADGVLLATIDMGDRTMNVLSPELIDALEALMDRVDRDAGVRAVVLTSGKASFLAGADLSMVREFCLAAKESTHQQMFELCGRLGRLFVRLEESAKPWIAAVNGLALGGGLELALACRHRIVGNGPKVQLGVPEIKLGLLPGAGGTQRLPRLAGYAAGLELLLTGRSMDPQEAVRLGVFEQAVPAGDLLAAARTLARARIGQPYDPDAKYPHLAQRDVPPYSKAVARTEALRAGIDACTLDHYPAHGAIVDAVLQGARRPLPEANTVEMLQFLRLMFDPVAGRMVRTLFLERLRAEREAAAAAVPLGTVALGPLSPPCEVWRRATARLQPGSSVGTAPSAATTPSTATAPSTAAAQPIDTMTISDPDGRSSTVRLGTIDSPVSVGPGETAAILAPASTWGRVMEVLGSDASAGARLSAVASRIGVLPWASKSDKSLLAELAGQPIERQAALALRHLTEHPACDPLLLDVAACLSGAAPGWTGGPLAWLWDEQQAAVGGLDPAARDAWHRCRARLQQAFQSASRSGAAS